MTKLLSLEADNNYLYVKALDSPRFIEIRNLLCTLSYRKAVYKGGEFEAWKLPKSYLSYFCDNFDLSDLKLNSASQDIVETYLASTFPLSQKIRDYTLYESKDGRTLFSYQRDYVNIDFSQKALLCSFQQGMGKTISALIRAKTIGYENLLIICPKRLLANWRTEINQCFEEKALIYAGSKKQREVVKEQIHGGAPVIVNYEMVKELTACGYEPDHVIIDEIHNLCNPSTQVHKEVAKLVENIPYRQGLSGTPMRLNPRDLWGVLALLDPKLAGTRRTFLDMYEVELAHRTIYKNFKKYRVPISFGIKNEDKLKKKLDSIMFRVKREGIVDFKETIEITHCPLMPLQRKLYDQIKQNILEDLDSGELKGITNVLTRLLRLLQASEGAFNLSPGRRDSGKLDYLLEDLTTRNDKVIIWSRFKPISNILGDLFKDKGVVYNGDVSDNLRNLAVWAFQGVETKEDEQEFYRLKKKYDFPFNPGDAQFFFGTVHLKSGLGINLHRYCSESIFTSFDFNPNSNFQAKDRVARIGQKEDVKTTFLVSEGTIENKSLKLILDNFQKTSRILDGEGNITYNQVKDLISILRET